MDPPSERPKRALKKPRKFADEEYEPSRKREKHAKHDEDAGDDNLGYANKTNAVVRSVSLETLRKRMKPAATQVSNESLIEMRQSHIEEVSKSNYFQGMADTSSSMQGLENVENSENGGMGISAHNADDETHNQNTTSPKSQNRIPVSNADLDMQNVSMSSEIGAQDVLKRIESMEVSLVELGKVSSVKPITEAIIQNIDEVKRFVQSSISQTTSNLENATSTGSGDSPVQNQTYVTIDQLSAAVENAIANKESQTVGTSQKEAQAHTQSVYTILPMNAVDIVKEKIYNDSELFNFKDAQKNIVFKVLRSYKLKASDALTFNAVVKHLTISLLTPEIVMGAMTNEEIAVYTTNVQTLVKMMIFREEKEGVPILRIIRNGETENVAMKGVNPESEKGKITIKGLQCKTVDARRNHFYKEAQKYEKIKNVMLNGIRHFKIENKGS